MLQSIIKLFGKNNCKSHREVDMMNKRILTEKRIRAFSEYLKKEEKSKNTVEKYIRDIRSFALYLNETEITKENVISYKNKLYEEN